MHNDIVEAEEKELSKLITDQIDEKAYKHSEILKGLLIFEYKKREFKISKMIADEQADITFRYLDEWKKLGADFYQWTRDKVNEASSKLVHLDTPGGFNQFQDILQQISVSSDKLYNKMIRNNIFICL